jgi:transcriptional regulator with XRE-family HTH domain
MPSPQNKRWERVGTAIRERMKEIPLNQAELCRRSTVSDATVRPLMNGQPRSEPSEHVLALISKALGWTPDSLSRIAAGGRPRVAPPVVVPDQLPDVVATQTAVEGLSLLAELTSRIVRLERKHESLERDLADRFDAGVESFQQLVERVGRLEE